MLGQALSAPAANCDLLSLRRGMRDLLEQTAGYQFQSILDIGVGDGYAARYFVSQGKEVTAAGFDMASYLTTPLPQGARRFEGVDICRMAAFADQEFDAIWCSHVLEHVQNPGLALAELHRVLKPDGQLFLIVPEYAPVLVGGHVSTGWNVGTLMYNLVLAGFDVRGGAFINHCWNVGGFVARGEMPAPGLRFDRGDLEVLADRFPIPVHQGMDASLLKVRWQWHKSIEARAEAEFRRVGRHRLLRDWLPPVLARWLARGLGVRRDRLTGRR